MKMQWCVNDPELVLYTYTGDQLSSCSQMAHFCGGIWAGEVCSTGRALLGRAGESVEQH